jgi:hypothetical protein
VIAGNQARIVPDYAEAEPPAKPDQTGANTKEPGRKETPPAQPATGSLSPAPGPPIVLAPSAAPPSPAPDAAPQTTSH